MKAITILEPWASLVACGKKHIETRSWAIKHRGPIAIHAGKDQDKKGERIRHIVARAEQYGIIIPELQFGKVIAIADLVDCVKVVCRTRLKVGNHEAMKAILENDTIVSGSEFAFGDYTPFRYAWILDNVRKIDPVPSKGMQRVWNWNEPFEFLELLNTCKNNSNNRGVINAKNSL